jgi:hypothetical protein
LAIVLINKFSDKKDITPINQLNIFAGQIKKVRARVYFFVLELGQISLIHAVIIINIALFFRVQNIEPLRHLWSNSLCSDLVTERNETHTYNYSFR